MDLLRTMPLGGRRSIENFLAKHREFFHEKRLHVLLEDQMNAIFEVFLKEVTWDWMDANLPHDKAKKFLNLFRSSEHHIKFVSFLNLHSLDSFRFRVFSNLLRVLDTSSTEKS